jgi:tetratricopeptide (TPR) repeat protein
MGGASHLIRSAEKLAASGRFDFAVEQLTVAQQLDPGNKYIHAIIERIRVQQNVSQIENSKPDNKTEESTHLSVTIGRQFTNGIRSSEDDQKLTQEDIHTSIRSLTNLANQYLEIGSSDQAFDSLMRAYLLDPLSPYVIATEKNVLPVWEHNRGQRGLTAARPDSSNDAMNNMLNIGNTSMAQSNSNNINSPFSPRPSQPSSGSQSAIEQQRMEMLMQQKEQERLEKERTVWREASKAPKIFGDDDPALSVQQQPTLERPKPQSGGLFSKLRLGKFLE